MTVYWKDVSKRHHGLSAEVRAEARDGSGDELFVGIIDCDMNHGIPVLVSNNKLHVFAGECEVEFF